MNQFNDIVQDTLDEWIYFLKNETIKDGFKAKGLAEAREKLDLMKLDEEETEEYDRYVEDRFHTILESSCFSLGQIAGEMIGREEGMQEGAEKERMKLIKKLLAAGLSIKQIASMIGITPDEVEDLLLIDL